MFLVILGFIMIVIGYGKLGIFIALMGIGYLFTEYVRVTMENSTAACPPHRWTVDENGKLWCLTCKNPPGKNERNV